MCDCKNLRRNGYGVEDYLLLIDGVADTLLSLSNGAGNYEKVFHFLGMTLSDYRDQVYALVVDGEDDEDEEAVPTPSDAAEANARSPGNGKAEQETVS
jgi:hypothetical protein